LSTSLRNSQPVVLAAAAAGLLVLGTALAFYWVPNAPVEGFRQRIFYVHVPIALTAYACFGWGAWKALRLLWTRERRYDLESYTAVHIGVIFGVLTLLTGSIWARTSWGHWWVWGSRQLVLFLVLFLFYAAYFMLRFSVDPGPRRANISAVYALFGVALIPVSFLAIRLAEDLVHPVVFTHDARDNLTASQFTTFGVCLAGMLALAGSLYVNELTGKRLDSRLRELREALQ
jgi:heme exporter protein C